MPNQRIGFGACFETMNFISGHFLKKPPLTSGNNLESGAVYIHCYLKDTRAIIFRDCRSRV